MDHLKPQNFAPGTLSRENVEMAVQLIKMQHQQEIERTRREAQATHAQTLTITFGTLAVVIGLLIISVLVKFYFMNRIQPEPAITYKHLVENPTATINK
jgi:hypothetical protein